MSGRVEQMLVLEDDERLRGALVRAFEGRGLQVREASCLAELDAIEAGFLDAAVVDLRLPDGSGLDAIERLCADNPELRVIVLTGYGSIATALEAVRRGAVDYQTKPADADQILAALEGDPTGGRGDPSEPAEGSAPSLQRVEWEHIQRVLADCGGNVTRAARALGVHRRTLQRKLSYRAPRS